MTTFWRNWMLAWCLGVTLFGLVLAGAGFAETSGPAQALIDRMNGEPLPLDRPLRFAIGLQGALSIAIAGLAWGAIRGADALGPDGAPVWRLLLWSMLAWYVIDSAISCANGFWLNAVSNTLLMVALLVPLMASGVLRSATPARV
ncbi:hypothetical protein [Sandarakinorhabdus sp. DWP1-3-1]|uniref:hypothetical protein n=1 Tax=Sandarakinorhabdus sp. DWP1-3-1 TaxID=2804627 RepID=UPI003CEEF420